MAPQLADLADLADLAWFMCDSPDSLGCCIKAVAHLAQLYG